MQLGPRLRGPSLSALNVSHDFMRFPDVQSVEREHDFSRFRVHSVDRDMQMIIVRIVVQPIDSLMFGQPYFFKEHIHHFLHLFPGGLLAFLPRKHPVLHRHVAVDRLPRKSDHLRFLTCMGC